MGILDVVKKVSGVSSLEQAGIGAARTLLTGKGVNGVLPDNLLGSLARKAILTATGGDLKDSALNALKNRVRLDVRTVLGSTDGSHRTFDPVWKLFKGKVAGGTDYDIADATKEIADDLAGADVPKSKFLFTVHIFLRDELKSKGKLKSKTLGAKQLSLMNFALKTASRPQPTVVYQDVNFYNYRTKIATKVDYGQLTLTFYDDSRNRAHDIYECYLKTISPIANRSPDSMQSFEDTGMVDSESPPDPASDDQINDSGDITVTAQRPAFSSASLGSLIDEDALGPIERILVVHHLPQRFTLNTFTGINAAGITSSDPSISLDERDSSNDNYMIYEYLNPKIITMQLDDLDMSQNELATVQFQFVYDAVNIHKYPENFDATKVVKNPISNTEKSITSNLIGFDATGIKQVASNAFNQVASNLIGTGSTGIKQVAAGAIKQVGANVVNQVASVAISSAIKVIPKF